MRSEKLSQTFAVVFVALLVMHYPAAMSLAATPFLLRTFNASQFVLGSNVGTATADDFILASPNLLGHVEWWGGILNAADTQPARSFLVRLYANANGAPAGLPFYSRTVQAVVADTGLDGTNSNFNGAVFNIYNYSADVPQIALSGGTVYWLSVLNADSVAPGAQWVWYASSFQPGGSVFFRDNGSDSWKLLTESSRNAMSMSLSVPEPGALAVFGIMVLGVLSRRK